MSNDVYVTVAGWVAKAPELRITADKSEWTSLRIASTPRRRQPDGQWTDGKTEWFEVKAWGELAENITKCVEKGHPVVVTGRLSTDEWRTNDGADRKNLVIHAQAIGHDLTRGRSTFVRVRHESGEGGELVDVTDAVELADDAEAVGADAVGADGSGADAVNGKSSAKAKADAKELAPAF